MRDKNGQETVPIPQTREELSLRLAEWRKTRRGRGRIPESLWAKAAELALEHGVYKTAKALGLDYPSLKKRVKPPATTTAATFVELISPLSGTIAECTVEVESTRGAKMRVEMRNVAPLGLAAIIRDFAG
jgi:hypothetical protein